MPNFLGSVWKNIKELFANESAVGATEAIDFDAIMATLEAVIAESTGWTPKNLLVVDDMVRERAYFKWKEDVDAGRPQRTSDEYWTAAKEELVAFPPRIFTIDIED